MRLRDALIVAVGIVAMIFGYSQEGTVSFTPGFTVPWASHRDYMIYNSIRPIITDLDGDGIPEMIASDENNDYLSIFPTNLVRRNTENVFLRLQPTHKTTFPGAIIAAAAGYLESPLTASRLHQATTNNDKAAGSGASEDGGENINNNPFMPRGGDDSLSPEDKKAAKREEQVAEKKRQAREKQLRRSDKKGFFSRLFGGGSGSDDLAAGYHNKKGTTQVVAVLTEFYNLRVMDHTLTELWNADVYPSYKAELTPHSATIMIRPERIFDADRGTIVVRVPIGGANGTEMMLYAAFDGATGSKRWSRIISNFAIAVDADGSHVPVMVAGNEGEEDINNAAASLKESKNVSRLLTDGVKLIRDAAGAEQQQEDNNDDSSSSNYDRSQRNKLGVFGEEIITEQDLEALHRGELPWQHFREAIIATLPHKYTHTWDATIVPSAFYKSKDRKKKTLDRTGNSIEAHQALNKDRRMRVDGDDVGELGEFLGRAQKKGQRRHVKKNNAAGDLHRKTEHVKDYHRQENERANVVVSHLKDGVHMLHLYTGKLLARVGPLRARDSIYHDIDDDFNIDEITNYIGTRQSVHTRIIRSADRRMPNIIRHGIDEDVLCSGSIYSGVPEAHDALYNATICDTPGLFAGMSLLGHFVRGDGAEELPTADALSLIGSRNIAREQTTAVAPLVIQRHIPKGRGLFLLRRYAIFMVDTGLVTALDPVSKRVLWRTQTDSAFSELRGQGDNSEEEVSNGLESETEHDSRSGRYPHLAAYTLRSNPLPLLRTMRRVVKEKHPYVLAIGLRHFALVNTLSGRVASTADLPHAPHGPVVVADFNGDGINDLVFYTQDALIGYLGHTHAGGAVIPMLMALLLLLVGLLVAAREVSSLQQQQQKGGGASLSDGEEGAEKTAAATRHPGEYSSEAPPPPAVLQGIASIFAGVSVAAQNVGLAPDDDETSGGGDGPTGILPVHHPRSDAQTTSNAAAAAHRARKIKRSTD